jgi:membrane-associated phospholipid phosphatase
MRFGSLTSSVRSPAQTQTALFWQSDSPTALWNRVAQQLLRRHDASLLGEARVLALLNMAQCDGVIAVWEAKNFFDTWRPITAIRGAATDGSPATVADPTWEPLITTPPFQEYPSGHAGASSSGANVLAGFFGQRTRFFLTSPAFPGEQRRFRSFAAALNDVADARTFAGIHFRPASVDAIAMGRHIARFLRRTMLLPRGGHRHH